MKVPLNGVRKLLSGIGNLGSYHIALQMLAKPLLFLSSPSSVAYSEFWIAGPQVVGKVRNVFLDNPHIAQLAVISLNLNSSIPLIIERPVSFHVFVQGYGTMRPDTRENAINNFIQ
jgi:hypothetical protein